MLFFNSCFLNMHNGNTKTMLMDFMYVFLKWPKFNKYMLKARNVNPHILLMSPLDMCDGCWGWCNQKLFTLLGVCTLRWPYMDVTMAIFFVFLKYKKINKIKFIEIIIKGSYLFKSIIINLPRMKKSNQNRG
jgi:hypothetical protein